jgi:predicted DNA-binding transcriptional regulator AlpA
MPLRQPDGFETMEEMSLRLRESVPSLYRHLAEGSAPPHIRVGRKILFPLGEVFDEWIREQASTQGRGGGVAVSME